MRSVKQDVDEVPVDSIGWLMSLLAAKVISW